MSARNPRGGTPRDEVSRSEVPEALTKDVAAGVTAPHGFRAAGVTAGLKASGTPDLALVVNDGPDQVGVAVFTSNRVVGAPVTWSRQAVADNVVHAVVLNSGGANVATGPDGFAHVHATAEKTADLLGASAADVVVCSTGLIGVPLAADTLLAGLDGVVAGLSTEGGPAAATAIMTTDTVEKQVVVPGAGWSVGGMAKGAGMLAPSLATMLVVLTTDAAVDAATADAVLRAATTATFDRIDSDGCMSTSDTVLLMSSGASGITPDADEFAAAVHSACAQLARALIADAEGAGHDIAIEVIGASDEAAALAVGRAVSRSNLFKAAMFGNDPNWGRIIAQVGTVPEEVAPFDPAELDVHINGLLICRAGGAHEDPTQLDLAADREVHVVIDLHAGDATATIWTNDLTHDYVHENSAYST